MISWPDCAVIDIVHITHSSGGCDLLKFPYLKQYDITTGAKVPVSQKFFFASNSNSMETSPCHNFVAGHQIATNCCACHNSTAVVPCTKFCSNHCIRIEVRVKRNFHRIWIAMENLLVKRAPGRDVMVLVIKLLVRFVAIHHSVIDNYENYFTWYRHLVILRNQSWCKIGGN